MSSSPIPSLSLVTDLSDYVFVNSLCLLDFNIILKIKHSQTAITLRLIKCDPIVMGWWMEVDFVKLPVLFAGRLLQEDFQVQSRFSF